MLLQQRMDTVEANPVLAERAGAGSLRDAQADLGVRTATNLVGQLRLPDREGQVPVLRMRIESVFMDVFSGYEVEWL
jgi:hypothetical protein